MGWLVLLCGAWLASCHGSLPGESGPGILDLRGHDWSRGPVNLSVDWAFRGGLRHVPDAWSGDVAGGPDGRGSGTYTLKVLVGDGAPPLALRWGSISTAARISVNGEVVAQAGFPDADPTKARSAFAPGTVRLPVAPELTLSIFVSNHDYRVGGLWTSPVLGSADAVEHGQWAEETAQIGLAGALTVIGMASFVFFFLRRSEVCFLTLGIFALLVALRTLVTGEYGLAKLVPGLPFDVLIRLEYLTAFLPTPAATIFFRQYYPGIFGRWGTRALVWPSVGFALLAVILPISLLTRSIPWYYPLSIPSLLWGSIMVLRRIIRDSNPAVLLVGMGALAGTGLVDTLTAALWSTTGNLVPWGMGIFVALQATSLVRRLLTSFHAAETHLAENELMVKEIHHRVKNSLQIVASLVTLQANRVEPGPQREVFQALRRRMTAVALVHEKLYAQGSAGLSDVGNYLRELMSLQYPKDSLGPGTVVWNIPPSFLPVGADFCVDVGLILTELVANSQKYALVTGLGTRLQVDVRIESVLVLEVIDDGPGFPQGFTPETSKGLGFRLIQTLLVRNQGKLTFPQGPGARVRVELSAPNLGSRSIGSF